MVWKSTIDVNANILDQSLSDKLKFMKEAFTKSMNFAMELAVLIAQLAVDHQRGKKQL